MGSICYIQQSIPRSAQIDWLLRIFTFLLLIKAFFPCSANMDGSKKSILQLSLVEKVNSNPGAKWKAGLNQRFSNTTVEDFKMLLGSFMEDEQEIVHMQTYPRDLILPVSFDARDAWPHCDSLRTILENDLLSCCGFECGNGCHGGHLLRAWQYLVRSGVVTAKCLPYFDSQGCQHPGCTPIYPTPECVEQCADNTDWQSEKYYASSAYAVGPDSHDIMAEVYINGPVEASFRVHEDFAHYNSGVYHHVFGDYLGGHAVKLIGWGTTDEGVDYWILANSWNRQWGQDGYFMIQRGVNECAIESRVVAGKPGRRRLVAVQ
ncbi:hypothetical protein KP509_30G008300 [Ceratopteris richardii]|uniref:Peptidase C1A papain C-terminal domain-containing protein n=1 Tax=Ceratopteris richardii TaxID=49495 RepID=A0A8T2QZK8_CERRI|nr:hypothetical protein KP509_30G008300 [Ceratopteris richardii]